jgi:RNA 2',3'-cyclic 3'-phosphodiesterase
MKRIFIAIKIDPGPQFSGISSTLRSLLDKDNIAWVDPSNLHITLAFLGDTEEERISIASIILKRISNDFQRFRFNLRGTGIFRNFNDPRVIWCGIEQSIELMQLNNLIMKELMITGFKVEERQFKPHITIGRIKSIRNAGMLKSAIERFQSSFIQEVLVSEVILFESILKPSGPVYKPVGIFKLHI